MYCIAEGTVPLLGFFGTLAAIRRPHSALAPGELCPLSPLVTPLFGRYVFQDELSECFFQGYQQW